MVPLALPIRTPLGYYIYDANCNEILKVSNELFDYIKNLLADHQNCEFASASCEADYSSLQEAGYLLPSMVKQIVHPATAISEILLDRSLGQLTLQVTQRCNLRCKYCIYSEDLNCNQRSHSQNTMTFETAKKAIDFYRLHSIDTNRAVIGFYGGEPLLAFPLIKDVVAYAKEVFVGKEIAFDMTTNATLLTDEVIDFLLENEFLLTFSIDGPQRVQDKNRVFPNGLGSYDTVISNIRRLYKKDEKRLEHAGINMVVDSTQSYSELLRLFDERELENVNLTYSLVEKDGVTLAASDDFIREYNYDSFISFWDYMRDHTLEGANKFMSNKINSLCTDAKFFKMSKLHSVTAPGGPCIPGKQRLFVNCFGDLYPCERVNENSCMRVGTLDTGFNMDQVKYILNVGQLTPEECKKCWAFSLCDICAKKVDDGQKLSPSLRRIACRETKETAFYKIREKILLYENESHLQKIGEGDHNQ